MDCFVFEAGGCFLGIEARHVYRILDDVEMAPVPLLPPCHLGIIYHRGDLFDMIDVGMLLGREGRVPDRPPYAILLKWDQRKLGLIPGRIIGITSVENKDNHETVFTGEGLSIHILTPEAIWKGFLEFPYGY